MRAIEVQMKNASGEELDRLMNTYTRLTTNLSWKTAMPTRAS